jgi:hypothetical protein
MCVLSEQEMITTFEAVLRERFELDPVACRESSDWWRFSVDGVTFQGGVHSADVRVLASLCTMSASVDIGAVYRDLEAAPTHGLARVIEADNYLYTTAQLPFAEVSAATIEQAIRDCVALRKSADANKLRAKWEDDSW